MRRIVVTETSGRICGIIAQADIAQTAAPAATAEVVKKISEPKAVYGYLSGEP